MSSIITAVFKATIGLLVNKGRDKAAEKLKDGDVTDQKFHGLIVREIDDIKSQLKGLARKDLLASISFFKEGIELLYEVFGKAKSRWEHGTIKEEAAAGTASAEAVSPAKAMGRLELTDLDESATRALANAKDRFKDARRKATEAFANEALELSDRVLAMQYRVMSTILETVDHPEIPLAACRVCIEELHSLSAVKECFTVELKRGFWARFSKEERRAIISATCHVNRTIYDVIPMVSSSNNPLYANDWPCVDTGDEKVDPLFDRRVSEVLQKQGMEHCCVPWSFGQEGKKEDKLKDPMGIATNADAGQFIIADNSDKSVKVFHSSGKFVLQFHPEGNYTETELDVFDVATDVKNSNIYVLVRLRRYGAAQAKREVQVFSHAADLLHKFPVRGEGRGRLAVTNNKVLVLKGWTVHVYEHEGRYVGSFGEGILKYVLDIIIAGPDGQIMTLDGSCVFIFTEDGKQQRKFNINTKEDEYWRIACHPSGEFVVVAGWERGTKHLCVAIYTKDGEFVRRIVVTEGKNFLLTGITVSMEGHIAVAIRNVSRKYGKVIVL